MRILFIGQLNTYTRTWQRMQTLKAMGHELYEISTVNTNFRLDYKPGLYGRLRWKLGIPVDEAHCNQQILQAITKKEFDLAWIEKGVQIKPATLKKLHGAGLPLLSFSEDDMFNKINRTRYYDSGLKYYDLVVTTKSYNCNDNELPAMGARRVIFVDKTYSPELHRPLDTPFSADVGFVGTFEKARADSILFLASQGIKVRVHGSGRWKSYLGKAENIELQGAVYGDDYIKALCSARINLCFLRKINRDLQTDRTMELPACGCFMLAERTVEHNRLFSEGKEAEYFDSDTELLQKVHYYLAHEDERAQIAQRGLKRCQDSHYDHQSQLTYLLEQIQR